MDLLRTLYLIKEFLVAGIQKFPLIIGSTSLLLACSTANVGYTLLFVSLIFVVPIAVFACNKILSPAIIFIVNFIVGLFSTTFKIDWTASNNAAVCRAAGAVSGGAFPTYYMAILFFVFGFTFWNGYSIYTYQSNSDDTDEKVQARKAHAIIGMISSLILLIIFGIVRFMSGCERGFGIFMSLPFFGLGIGMFELFKFCGLIRLVDLYGVGSRLLSKSATNDPAGVCFPVENVVTDTTPTTSTSPPKTTNVNQLLSFSGK